MNTTEQSESQASEQRPGRELIEKILVKLFAPTWVDAESGARAERSRISQNVWSISNTFDGSEHMRFLCLLEGWRFYKKREPEELDNYLVQCILEFPEFWIRLHRAYDPKGLRVEALAYVFLDALRKKIARDYPNTLHQHHLCRRNWEDKFAFENLDQLQKGLKFWATLPKITLESTIENAIDSPLEQTPEDPNRDPGRTSWETSLSPVRGKSDKDKWELWKTAWVSSSSIDLNQKTAMPVKQQWKADARVVISSSRFNQLMIQNDSDASPRRWTDEKLLKETIRANPTSRNPRAGKWRPKAKHFAAAIPFILTEVKPHFAPLSWIFELLVHHWHPLPVDFKAVESLEKPKKTETESSIDNFANVDAEGNSTETLSLLMQALRGDNDPTSRDKRTLDLVCQHLHWVLMQNIWESFDLQLPETWPSMSRETPQDKIPPQPNGKRGSFLPKFLLWEKLPLKEHVNEKTKKGLAVVANNIRKRSKKPLFSSETEAIESLRDKSSGLFPYTIGIYAHLVIESSLSTEEDRRTKVSRAFLKLYQRIKRGLRQQHQYLAAEQIAQLLEYLRLECYPDERPEIVEDYPIR